MPLDDWFLDASERGNRATEIDRRHGGGTAWTEGNDGRVLVDGTEYFARLYDVLCATRPGDWLYFTDWQGDPDEELAGPGTAVGDVIAQLAGRGVHVRGLLWRSHPEAMNFGEGKNLSFSRVVNEAGGQVLLDQRVRRGGSHHQKLLVVRGAEPSADVAFVGGIDLCHGRRDDARHLGDPQVVDLDDEHYGERPPWHDLQLELHGPAVDDVAYSFAERWTDPTPIDSRNPARAALHRFARHPDDAGPLAPERPAPGDGPLAVQVLRTYPARRQPYPFAPDGERSIARAYLKAFQRARRLIYLEDQYLWSVDATRVLCESLAAHPDLHIVAVIPRYPDPDGAVAGEASRIGRERVLDALHGAGHERVAVYDLENDAGTPIYVHSKVCIVDDVWMAIGSDNLNRRSWTHDSELSCAVIDTRLDDREPSDPGGLGDGARVLARDTRIRLAAEHLGRGADDAELVDPKSWFEALRAGADALDAWHRFGAGPRPPGHLREHPRERVTGMRRWGRGLAHQLLLDPDGRPRSLRRRDEF
ncbi:MAG TPA: phospholipase D-like domain-containing protein [Acidimicrobiia bacterium]|nr:phospholipase D-like domain-containing protein [Acidimicrobiia bacterium]